MLNTVLPEITILSLNVSLPGIVKVEGSRPFRSSIRKSPKEGKVFLGKTGLDGDQVGDPVLHGGPDKAICVYSADHFPGWEKELGRSLAPGCFGENLTISGILEKDMHIGDIFEIGDVRVQCAQPRQPCHKLNKVFSRKDMACMVKTRGSTGFYMRVLKEGYIQSNQALEFVKREDHGFSVEAINQLMTKGAKDQELLNRALSLDSLADACKKDLRKKLR